MAITLLPAVDVAGGAVVRAGPGGSVAADPVAVALGLQAAGAAWFHLVDLDAAYGRGSNGELLAAVVAALDVDVQLSGGISDDPSLDRALATGCARANLSTTALHDWSFCERAIDRHGERVAVSLDVDVVGPPGHGARYRLAARGSTTDGGDLWDALDRLDRIGCARYVVTDVDRDGRLRGPAVELCRSIAAASPASLIASGGISSIDDLLELDELAAQGIEGAIVGTALHAGRFTLPEAIDALRRADQARG